jgi:hypothetical protein
MRWQWSPYRAALAGAMTRVAAHAPVVQLDRLPGLRGNEQIPERMSCGSDQMQDLEREAIGLILDQDGSQFEVLREQLTRSTVHQRHMTGAGFFTSLRIPEGAPAAPEDLKGPLRLGPSGAAVVADIDGLSHGAGFVLWLDGDRLDQLEGFTLGDEAWPDQIHSFAFQD